MTLQTGLRHPLGLAPSGIVIGQVPASLVLNNPLAIIKVKNISGRSRGHRQGGGEIGTS